MDDMWNLADTLGLRIVDAHGPHSSYNPTERTIRLTRGLRGRIARSVIAHEIGHFVLGHRPTRSPHLRERQEHTSNTWAAMHLITPDAYQRAERRWDGHTRRMAVDLHVADELVTTYRAILLEGDFPSCETDTLEQWPEVA